MAIDADMTVGVSNLDIANYKFGVIGDLISAWTSVIFKRFIATNGFQACIRIVFCIATTVVLWLLRLVFEDYTSNIIVSFFMRLLANILYTVIILLDILVLAEALSWLLGHTVNLGPTIRDMIACDLYPEVVFHPHKMYFANPEISACATPDTFIEVVSEPEPMLRTKSLICTTSFEGKVYTFIVEAGELIVIVAADRTYRMNLSKKLSLLTLSDDFNPLCTVSKGVLYVAVAGQAIAGNFEQANRTHQPLTGVLVMLALKKNEWVNLVPLKPRPFPTVLLSDTADMTANEYGVFIVYWQLSKKENTRILQPQIFHYESHTFSELGELSGLTDTEINALSPLCFQTGGNQVAYYGPKNNLCRAYRSNKNNWVFRPLFSELSHSQLSACLGFGHVLSVPVEKSAGIFMSVNKDSEVMLLQSKKGATAKSNSSWDVINLSRALDLPKADSGIFIIHDTTSLEQDNIKWSVSCAGAYVSKKGRIILIARLKSSRNKQWFWTDVSSESGLGTDMKVFRRLDGTIDPYGNFYITVPTEDGNVFSIRGQIFSKWIAAPLFTDGDSADDADKTSMAGRIVPVEECLLPTATSSPVFSRNESAE